MFKTWGIVASVGVVLVMSGCSAAADVAAVPETPAATSAPVLTAAPATPEQDTFLTATHRIAGLEDVKLADALAVGDDVCAKLDAGADPLTMTPVQNADGEVNEEMVLVSVLTLCTAHNDPVQQAFIERRAAKILAENG